MEGGFRPGAVLLGKYRVESVLGRGGMGIVLRVTHLHLGEELAIKILLPKARAIRRCMHAFSGRPSPRSGCAAST